MALLLPALLPLVLLAPAAGSEPQQQIMPAFSWATLPVAWHSGNSTGRYTDAQIRELARYPMVTLEKFQGLREIVPAETLAGPYETGLYACQDNATGSLARCGCCAEDEMTTVFRRLKALNPQLVTVAYFNAQIAYPWYRAARALAQNPAWWLTAHSGAKHSGPPGSTWQIWDLSIAAAAEAWREGCVNATRTGVIDSCFVDGCMANDLPGNAGLGAATHKAIAELQSSVPGPIVCGTGGDFKSRLLKESGVRGYQDEGWGVIDRRTGKTSFATREIPGLMAAAARGVVFQAHGRAVCGIAGKPCENRTAPCWRPLPHYTEPAVQTELAAFLVAMGRYSYFVCGTWENYPANASTWNPVYDLPLGAPLSDAKLGADGVW